MALDAWLRLSSAARLAGGLLLLSALGMLAAALIVSLLRSREAMVSLALRWEASLRSEGDLVAALQFEERVLRGTALPLERAVVAYVGACAPHLPPPPQESGLPRPIVALAVSLLVAGAWFAAAPGLAVARLTRLLLGSPPARSQILSLSVAPSRKVRSAANSDKKDEHTALLVPAWRPLRLRAAIAGPRPERCDVRLISVSGGSIRLPLLPSSPAGSTRRWYDAHLPPLGAPATCEVHAGEGPPRCLWLTPVSPPPLSLVWHICSEHEPTGHVVSSPSLEVVAPPHARLQLSIRCPQKLLGVELVLGRAAHGLVHTNDGTWSLRKPLAVPARAGRIAYSLHVRDAYGFTWHRQVKGGIRVHAPAPLTVRLAAAGTEVLSHAAAEIRYVARGGDGVSRLDLHVRLWREDSLAGHVQRGLGVGPGRPMVVAGAIWLDLTEVRAQAGDELEILLEAAGPRGQAVFSEPLRLAVVDPLALLERLRRPEAWLDGEGSGETSVHARGESEEDP
jgi:hypothetical protein